MIEKIGNNKKLNLLKLEFFTYSLRLYLTKFEKLSKFQLLIFDDWFRDPLTADQVRNLLEIFDDRWQSGSAIFVSQIPVEKWHESLVDPTLADAILDRVIHNSFKIKMKGESMRKMVSKKQIKE